MDIIKAIFFQFLQACPQVVYWCGIFCLLLLPCDFRCHLFKEDYSLYPFAFCFRYVKNHHHIQHLSYRSVSRLTIPWRGVGVEVLDLDPMRMLRRVPGTLNLGKHCMTSQQAAMMRYGGCNSWLRFITFWSPMLFFLLSLMGYCLLENTFSFPER